MEFAEAVHTAYLLLLLLLPLPFQLQLLVVKLLLASPANTSQGERRVG
jgi:hypothetical protein